VPTGTVEETAFRVGSIRELGYQGHVASERQFCVDPVFDRLQPQLLESADLGGRPLLVRHLRVRASPPQAERLVQKAGRPLGVPDRKRPLPLGRQRLESASVDVLDV
jgi:hypothetical protein